MRAVGLKELEERIDEYVHLAEGGETVLVTDQERVLAELIPPRRVAVPASADESPLTDAVRRGWIQPAISEAGTPLRLPVAPLDDLLQELQRDRSDY